MANIIVVDDHQDMRHVLAQLLAMHGHVVWESADAEAAWDRMQETVPDALIVDQNLPGMTGLELLTRMRKTPALANVPTVLCSGEDTDREAALAAGAADFWEKGTARLIGEISRFARNFKPS